jgi:DNA-binding MarR family transcriptional regulator
MSETTTSPHRTSPLLDHLARLNRARAEAALAPLNLRPRHLVALTLLRDHGGGTQQAMAEALRIDRTNLVGLLNELEADGLITRTRAAEDRRRHIVQLTDAGHTRLHEAECALAVVENEVLSALDDAQREQLYELLALATSGHVVSCGEAVADDVADAC